jgi:hypothetical protein
MKSPALAEALRPLRRLVTDAQARYVKRANNQIDVIAPARSGDAQAVAVNRTRDRLRETQPLIRDALAQLRKALAPEAD